MSTDVIRKAYQATEEGFLSVVSKQWHMKPQIAAVGSCCLVGVICGGTLYVANLGDSRAVLGKLVKATGEVLANQLSSEHNVGLESVRQEMYSLHPDDSHIVVLKHNVWRVKGLIQVTSSDVYDCGMDFTVLCIKGINIHMFFLAVRIFRVDYSVTLDRCSFDVVFRPKPLSKGLRIYFQFRLVHFHVLVFH